MSVYASKASIVALIQNYTPEIAFTEADLPDIVWQGAADIIDAKADNSFNAFTGDIYVDGQGEKFIFSPLVPIISLSGITRIHPDTTTYAYVILGTTRELWLNEQTGLIELITGARSGIEYDESLDSPVFPKGVKNIKITGSFGDVSVTNILYLLQAFCVFKP